MYSVYFRFWPAKVVLWFVSDDLAYVEQQCVWLKQVEPARPVWVVLTANPNEYVWQSL